jgi:hypothetical protein
MQKFFRIAGIVMLILNFAIALISTLYLDWTRCSIHHLFQNETDFVIFGKDISGLICFVLMVMILVVIYLVRDKNVLAIIVSVTANLFLGGTWIILATMILANLPPVCTLPALTYVAYSVTLFVLTIIANALFHIK